MKKFIDLNQDPYVPEGWTVESHQEGGKFNLSDISRISLYLSPRQMGGHFIYGTELQKELKNVSVLNAVVLDWLLAHPKMIPAEWKGKNVCFFGTIYRDVCGDLSFRHLDWYGGKCIWGRKRLHTDHTCDIFFAVKR